MIEILEKPDELIKRKFHCPFCGCRFQADRGDYTLISNANIFSYGVKYRIGCPWCGFVNDYTDEDSEYVYIKLENE